MSWSISADDIKAIEILQREGQRSLTDLVREIYGIEVDENGKEDNGDRLKKLNRFKKHLMIMVKEGFLQDTQAKTETSNRPITVYSLSKEMIVGKGALLIITGTGIDFTEIGQIIKIMRDGKAAILPITV